MANIIPAGTILAFAGKNIPTGWLLCDGKELDKNDSKFKDLFEAIGTAWGGDANPTFYIPDLRGKFLRGVANGSYLYEPMQESKTRLAARPDLNTVNKGNEGDNVGSLQISSTKMPQNKFSTESSGLHNHGTNFEINASRDTGSAGNTVAKYDPAINNSHRTTNEGSHKHEIIGGDLETRPINAYVNFIIKL